MSGMRKKVLVVVCILMMLTVASAWAVPEMVLVKAGSFQMGNTRGDSEGGSDEKPVHLVKLTYDYEIGKYELTNEQFLEFLNDAKVASNGYLNQHKVINISSSYCEFQYKNGRFTLKQSGKTNYPVIEITWWGAVEYCNWLSETNGLAKAYDSKGNLTGTINQVKGYRLPTEAEWEYAARGGHKSTGDYKYSGSNSINSVAWHVGNSQNSTYPIWQGKGTHKVGQKSANKLGIYDMTGNVWEWCHDKYGSYTRGTQTNPTGSNSSSERVARGGCWGRPAEFCRVSGKRNHADPTYSDLGLGVRIARTRD
jgi:formylglycine-generating enzyme required for sulfatase activity